MATREAIDTLKANWLADPTWTLENSKGFEEHAEELAAFEDEAQSRWDAEEQVRKERRCAELGIPGNLALLKHLEELEYRIRSLSEALGRHTGNG